MATLEVMFEVPKHIAAGLSLGTMERVGGVIRDTSSKQIVAWLRDGIEVDTTSQALQAIGTSAQGLLRLVGAGQLLSLAVTSATLNAISRRLDQLSEDIVLLGENVRVELESDRDSNFKSALKLADDAFQASIMETRKQRATQAIEKLYVAEEDFTKGFSKFLSENPQAAQHYLTHSLYAVVSRIYCNLQEGELGLAQNGLQQALSTYYAHTCDLVVSFLGSHPAVFLHPDVSREDVNRFISIQNWLNPSHSIVDVVDTLRSDFWNQEAVRFYYRDEPVDPIRFVKRMRERVVPLAERLSQRLSDAEAAIHNHQCLEGFDMEVRYMLQTGMSFDEWQALSEGMIENHGWLLLAADEPILLQEAS